MLFTSQLLGMVRGITTGGSSVHYYATCFPVPVEMLKSHGIDITDEAEEMRNELPIAHLKDEMIGPMATRIMESAQDLGYNWQKTGQVHVPRSVETGISIWPLWRSVRCKVECQNVH
jgi:hypothetical protein